MFSAADFSRIRNVRLKTFTNAKLTTALLIPQLGPNFPVPEIGTRMRCSACASKDIATRPSWPARDQGLARSG